MSAETIKQIVERAIADHEFRAALVSEPAKALQGLELTAEEAEMFNGLTNETFDALVSGLEDRISRAGLDPIHPDAGPLDASARPNKNPYSNFNF